MALQSAKSRKYDEFYTQLSDVESELKHYRKHFKGKTVLCNCDDPFESNFFKYFVLNFNKLGLKELIATCYAGSPVAKTFPFGAYKAIVTKVYDIGGDGAINMEDIKQLFEAGENTLVPLEGDGDFRSEECVELLREADIVCTNPPFSLFREYLAQLMAHGKQFLIIGNKNDIPIKDVFAYLKEGRIWIGYGQPKDFIGADGNVTKKVNGLCRWFTNLDIKKRYEEFVPVKKYTPEEYPRYENYDAINVDDVPRIPYDYDGVMGVPITFMDKFNPAQFEILECHEPAIALDVLRRMPGFKEFKSRQTYVNGVLCQKKYHRIFIQRKV